MARDDALLLGLAGDVIPPILRTWLMTLRWRIMGGFHDRVAHRHAGPVLWAFWHSQLLFPAFIGRDRGIRILISRHRDGEFIARVAKGLGYNPVRGSTSSGGAEALIDLVRESGGRDVAITPDGPRGPREVVQPGVITLAQQTGMPIMPVAAAAWPRKRLGSWDGFVVPAPFACAAITIGEIIRVPPGADRDAREDCRRVLERQLQIATERADAVCREFSPKQPWAKHHHPYSAHYDERVFTSEYGRMSDALESGGDCVRGASAGSSAGLAKRSGTDDR